MQLATTSASLPDLASRPGLTSLVRTGRGLMTVQTEIVGHPAELVTIVDFRGRVLKTWRAPLTVGPLDPAAPEHARRWHADIEARVRESLARAAGRNAKPSTDADVASHLFLAAAEAYAERDLETAKEVLIACELLLPDDERVRAALDRLRLLGARS